MIKCRNCGTENESDMLYCIRCGGELNIKIIKAPVQKLPLSKIILRAVFVFLIFVIAYLAYSLIYPSIILPELPVLTKSNLTISENKMRALEFGRKNDLKFNADELTVLYNKFLSGKNLNNSHLFISVDNNKNLVLTTLVQFHNSVDILTPVSVTGTPFFDFIDGKKEVTDLNIKGITIGKLPIPESMYKYVLPYFYKYYNSRTKRFLRKIFDIKIDKNKNVKLTIYSKKAFYL